MLRRPHRRLRLAGSALLLALGIAAGGSPRDVEAAHTVAVPPADALVDCNATGSAPGDCVQCHAEIHAEWLETRHAKAWEDPIYQRALRDLERPERCWGCHVPQPVQARLGRTPRARDEDRVHGIHCGSCHAWRGRIAGPFGAETDAHESVAHPAFRPDGSLALCGSCHDTRIGPVLPLARDFRDAKLAARGKSCIGCHMRRVTRPVARDASGRPLGPPRRGRSHVIRGPSDAEFCASAFGLRVEPLRDRNGYQWLRLSVGNRAGHRVPGLTTRRFALRMQGLRADGSAVGEPAEVVISAENVLGVGETRRFRARRPADAVEVEVTIEHDHDGRRETVLRKLFSL